MPKKGFHRWTPKMRSPWQSILTHTHTHTSGTKALLNGVERNGGDATFVWQERAQTRATQMTKMPPLKPLTPRHKTNTCRKKNSRGISYCANTCGACIRFRANTGKYFWGIMFCIFAKFLREFISVPIHVAPVFAPARIQENISGELFMYWFRARG